MAAENSGGSVRVVERVMRILTCLSVADADAELKLTDISRQTGVHVSTALRFLRTLESGGFVATGQNGKGWRLGPALIDLRVRAIGQSDIRALAKPIMKEISQRTGETVQLAILVDDSIVYVEKVEPRDIALRINTAIGDRRPVHCTALGKVLAANSDPAEMNVVVQKMEMQRFTPYTITDRAVFKEELAKVRRQGVGIDNREFNRLVVCAAAPIRAADGHVLAAVSISTIGNSAESELFQEYKKIIREGSRSISRAIGWEDRPESEG